jgi:hypothetical protein
MGAGIKTVLTVLACLFLLALLDCQSDEAQVDEGLDHAERFAALELLWDPASGEIEFIASEDSEDCGEAPDSSLNFSAHDAAIAGDIVYVAFDQGLLLIDIANPASPSVLGRYALPTVQALEIADERAYIACGIDGLLIVDLGDPRAPRLVEHLDTPGLARGLALAGDHLYLADGPSGLQIFDVGDAERPRRASAYDPPGAGDAWEVEVRGDLAYVADGPAGLHLIDISDPAQPRALGGIDTPGYAGCIEVDGDHVYIADGFNGVMIYDVSTPSAPRFAASFSPPNFACAVYVTRQLAFVADFGSGLQILDVAQPDSPRLRYRCDVDCDAVDVIVRGDRAYLLSVDKLHVVDVSDPESLLETGSCVAADAGG